MSNTVVHNGAIWTCARNCVEGNVAQLVGAAPEAF